MNGRGMLLEVLVDEGDCGGTGTDGGGYPTRRSVADVADGEDSGEARLKELGCATPGQLRSWYVVAGEQIAVFVTSNILRQPVRPRFAADHHEETGCVDNLLDTTAPRSRRVSRSSPHSPEAATTSVADRIATFSMASSSPIR